MLANYVNNPVPRLLYAYRVLSKAELMNRMVNMSITMTFMKHAAGIKMDKSLEIWLYHQRRNGLCNPVLYKYKYKS